MFETGDVDAPNKYGIKGKKKPTRRYDSCRCIVVRPLALTVVYGRERRDRKERREDANRYAKLCSLAALQSLYPTRTSTGGCSKRVHLEQRETRLTSGTRHVRRLCAKHT